MIAQKLIGMLRLDSERSKRRFGEVFQIGCHNHVAAADDGGGKYMPIIRVWEPEGWDQSLIAFDQGIAGVAAHQVARTLQLGAVAVWLIFQQVLHPFTVNIGSPPGLVDIRDRKLQQQITHRSWIQDVGIEQCRVSAHRRE